MPLAICPCVTTPLAVSSWLLPLCPYACTCDYFAVLTCLYLCIPVITLLCSPEIIAPTILALHNLHNLHNQRTYTTLYTTCACLIDGHMRHMHLHHDLWDHR